MPPSDPSLSLQFELYTLAQWLAFPGMRLFIILMFLPATAPIK